MAAAAITVLGLALLSGPAVEIAPPSAAGSGALAPPIAPEKVAGAPSTLDPRLLDRRPMLGTDALALWSGAPLSAAFVPAAPVLTAAIDLPNEPARSVSPLPAAARTAQIAPLPVPRPAELRDRTVAGVPRVAARQPTRRIRTAARQAAPEDTRSFFEKLFGIQPSSGPAFAYTALDSKPVEAPPPAKVSPSPLPAAPRPAAGAGIAVYDISARAVTLPNGERLEAHSGLGDKLDDPRHVNLRMRGATPPGTYDLTEREALFHGVRALRLNPVGGSAAVHGRAGLLAHSFMLGPNGDSNGCVSFRDYDRFLAAYLRGEVRRLVVVAGSGWGSPGFAGTGAGAGIGSVRRPSANAHDA